MPLRVQTLKSSLYHLANLGVSRARPVSIYRLDGEKLPPGDFKVLENCKNPDNPEATYGFHVTFDGVAVDCWVEGITCDELAQVKAAYDHNVATLYPHVLDILDARAKREAAHKVLSDEFGAECERLRQSIFGTAKRNGTSLHDASETLHTAIGDIKKSDLPHWSEFKASESHLRAVHDKATPGLAGGLNWHDYLKKAEVADALA